MESFRFSEALAQTSIARDIAESNSAKQPLLRASSNLPHFTFNTHSDPIILDEDFKDELPLEVGPELSEKAEDGIETEQKLDHATDSPRTIITGLNELLTAAQIDVEQKSDYTNELEELPTATTDSLTTITGLNELLTATQIDSEQEELDNDDSTTSENLSFFQKMKIFFHSDNDGDQPSLFFSRKDNLFSASTSSDGSDLSDHYQSSLFFSRKDNLFSASTSSDDSNLSEVRIDIRNAKEEPEKTAEQKMVTKSQGRRIIATTYAVSGAVIAMVFSGGTAIIPMSLAAAVSGVIGYHASDGMRNLANYFGKKYGNFVEMEIFDSIQTFDEDAKTKYKEIADQTIGVGVGLAVGVTAVLASGGIAIPIILGAGAARLTTALSRRNLDNSGSIQSAGYFIDKKRQEYVNFNKGKLRLSTTAIPQTMQEASTRKNYQQTAAGTISLASGVIFSLTALVGGGVVVAPLAAASAYIATKTIGKVFFAATTPSNDVPAINNIGDFLAKFGRAFQELAGSGWSIPTFLISKAFNDRFARGALQGLSAANLAAALMDTGTAIKLMKHLPPEKIDQPMSFLRVQHKLRRSVAWGAFFNIGLCLVINYVIPPMGLASLKITSYYLGAIIVAGWGASSITSYQIIKYLDRFTSCLASLYFKYQGPKTIVNEGNLINDDDVLSIETRLLKGSTTFRMQEVVRDGEFVGCKNIIFHKDDFHSQKIIDDFNATIKRNWAEIHPQDKGKVFHLKRDGEIIHVDNVTIYAQKDKKQLIKTDVDGIKTLISRCEPKKKEAEHEAGDTKKDSGSNASLETAEANEAEKVMRRENPILSLTADTKEDYYKRGRHVEREESRRKNSAAPSTTDTEEDSKEGHAERVARSKSWRERVQTDHKPKQRELV